MTEQSAVSTAPAPAAHGGRPAGSRVAPLVAGVVMVGAGLLLLTQVFAINADGFDPQGPRFFPLVVITLLTALSAVYLGQQVRALVRGTELLPAEPFTHMPAVAVLLGLLVAYAFVLGPLGYVVTTSLFFVGAARAMGSHNLSRDVVVGIGLSLLVYLTFSYALGVSLPAGVLPL